MAQCSTPRQWPLDSGHILIFHRKHPMFLAPSDKRPSSLVTRSMAIGMPSRATGVNFSGRTGGVVWAKVRWLCRWLQLWWQLWVCEYLWVVGVADFGQSQSLCGENCENLLKIERFESRKIASNLLEFYIVLHFENWDQVAGTWWIRTHQSLEGDQRPKTRYCGLNSLN